MEYDNNNRGAVFPPRNNQKLILQGNAEMDNKPFKVIIVSDESKSGNKYLEVYEKVGVLFTNSYKEPDDNKPHYTGELDKYDKRIAGWKQSKGDMEYLAFRITDPLENEVVNTTMKDLTPADLGDEEVPFGKELDEMAEKARKGEIESGW